MDVVRSRRTIGKSTGEVTRAMVNELIEAAVWAPNHKLTQPWTFTIVDGAERERLGRLWAERAAAGVESAHRAAFIEGEAAKLQRAPTIIVVSTCTDPNPVRAEEDLTATAAAVQNMLLVAHARGLAAAWKTGKMVYDEGVKAHLGLKSDDRIVAFIYLGSEALECGLPRERDTVSCVRWMSETVVPA
jgi:nitroreductase